MREARGREPGPAFWKRQTRGMETHRAWGSGKTSSWICIMRSPPGANSVTKQAWLEVWKQARRDSRKGCPVRPTASRIRFSQYRLQGRAWVSEGNRHQLCPATHRTPQAHCASVKVPGSYVE